MVYRTPCVEYNIKYNTKSHAHIGTLVLNIDPGWAFTFVYTETEFIFGLAHAFRYFNVNFRQFAFPKGK